MRIFKGILNLAISATGLWLVARVLFTYNSPIEPGSLFVLLICVKCCVEVIAE